MFMSCHMTINLWSPFNVRNPPPPLAHSIFEKQLLQFFQQLLFPNFLYANYKPQSNANGIGQKFYAEIEIEGMAQMIETAALAWYKM